MRDQELAQVGDLGFAGRVVDRRAPVGEHGGGHEVLGRADARELEGDVGAVQPIGDASR